jgi:N-acetylglucosamine-6-phosphate deacetylase
MSSVQIQETRKAQNIAAATEALKEAGMPTPRTDEALAEPIIADDHKMAAGYGDLAESYARLSRALDHVVNHVIPSQDAEIERLKARDAEPSGKAQPKK